MTEIDKETGLPVLPKGWFWRVENTGINLWGMELGYAYSVSIREHVPASEWGEWRKSPDVAPGNTTHDQESRVAMPAQGRPGRWSYQPAVLEYRSRRMSHERLVAYLNIDVEDFDPAKILEYANQVLEDQRKDAAVDAVLGDYPPKRLEEK